MINMSLGLISRLFSCSPLLLEWMGISTSGTRLIEGPVHSLLKQLQYQACPLSTGGLRKYALLLGACVPHSAFWPFWAHNPGPFSTLIFAPFLIGMPYVLKLSIVSTGSMDIGTRHMLFSLPASWAILYNRKYIFSIYNTLYGIIFETNGLIEQFWLILDSSTSGANYTK